MSTITTTTCCPFCESIKIVWISNDTTEHPVQSLLTNMTFIKLKCLDCSQKWITAVN